MSKNSFSGAAAGGGSATPHKQKSSELTVSLEKKDPRDTCSSSLRHLCFSKVTSILQIDEENGPKGIKLTLTFSNPEEAAEAKKRLKNLEVKMSSKDKDYTRKISVEIAKPKKHDPSSAPAPALPVFDPQCLAWLMLDPIDPVDKRQPKWLIDSVRCTLFNGVDAIPSVEYDDMTEVKYYINRKDISFIRIPHPGNPSLAKECVEMTGKGAGISHFNYQFLKVSRIPTAILHMPECWTR
jgi:hypothetical protein